MTGCPHGNPMARDASCSLGQTSVISSQGRVKIRSISNGVQPNSCSDPRGSSETAQGSCGLLVRRSSNISHYQWNYQWMIVDDDGKKKDFPHKL